MRPTHWLPSRARLARRSLGLALVALVMAAGALITPAPAGAVPPGCGGTYAANSRYLFDQTTSHPSAPDWSVDGWGPGTLTLSKNVSVSNSWTANAGISASGVSAGVGFSVTWTGGTTTSYSIEVPSNERWQIYASEVHRVHGFDIYTCDNRYVGNGYAYQYNRLSYGSFRMA